MAIVKRQKGEAALAAKAGKAIGRQRAAERGQAVAERQEQQAIAMAERRKAEQAARDWEFKKMEMRSQQSFQQELAAKQWDYEKFNRAKAWEIEKLEMRSRIDFEREEKERSEKQAKTAAGVKAIRESTDIFPNQAAKDKAEFDFKFKQEHGYLPPGRLQEKQNVLGLLGGDTTPPPEPIKGMKTFVNPKTKEPIYIPDDQPFISVQHPTKGIQNIRVEQLEEAIRDYDVIYIPKQQERKPRTKEEESFEATLGLHRGIYGGF